MTATPPLLQLAAGRKVRPRKPPITRPKESVLHFAVAKLLREHCLPEWQWTHIPNGELRDIRTAVKLKLMGTKPGWPDIFLINPDGTAHCLELKRQGEDLNDAQETFRLWCVRHGVPYCVADTFDAALAVLDHWAALRIRIPPRVAQGGAP